MTVQHSEEYYRGEARAIGRDLADRPQTYSNSQRPRRQDDPHALLPHAWQCKTCGEIHEGTQGQWKARKCLNRDAESHTPTPHLPRHAESCDQDPPARRIQLTRASSIQPRKVRWLWKDRRPLGALGLTAGREGLGKSILEYTLLAMITRGTLPGAFFGTPRSGIVAATEDAWDYTIVPRLMAAGADLDLVYRVEVITSDLGEAELSLPKDLAGLEHAALDVRAATILLDPLMSRLDASLDTHKDGEVRRALEPLVTLADRTEASVNGLIHVNKGGSSDPLTSIMGSRAFTAVARSVLYVMSDPDDETTRLVGTAKNNLGRTDLPTLAFQIIEARAAETAEGDILTGKLQWTGESDKTIRDAMQAAAETSAVNKTVVGEAADWLSDYLSLKDGTADSADIKRDGAKAGHSVDALKRARLKLNIVAVSVGFPRRTHWMLQSAARSALASTAELAAPGNNRGTTKTG